MNLALPIADHRGRADQQHGGLAPAVFFRRGLLGAGDQRQGLHGLAQAHVVGQAGAQPPAAEEREPGIAARLVGPQRAVQPGRRRQILDGVAPGQAVEQCAEPALDIGAAHRRVLLAAERHAQHVARRGLLAAALQPGQGVADLGRVEQHPLAAHADQRRLEPGQRGQLLARQGLVAERDLPVEPDDGVEAQLAAVLHLGRPHRGAGGEPGLGAPAGPPGRQQHAEPGLLQRRGVAGEERAGRLDAGGATEQELEAELEYRVKSYREYLARDAAGQQVEGHPVNQLNYYGGDLGYERSLSRRLTWSLDVGATYRHDPFEGYYTYRSGTVDTELVWEPLRDVELAVEVGWRRVGYLVKDAPQHDGLDAPPLTYDYLDWEVAVEHDLLDFATLTGFVESDNRVSNVTRETYRTRRSYAALQGGLALEVDLDRLLR